MGACGWVGGWVKGGGHNRQAGAAARSPLPTPVLHAWLSMFAGAGGGGRARGGGQGQPPTPRGTPLRPSLSFCAAGPVGWRHCCRAGTSLSAWAITT